MAIIPKVSTSSASSPVPWACQLDKPLIVAVPVSNEGRVSVGKILMASYKSGFELRSAASNTDCLDTEPTLDDVPSATLVLILTGLALPWGIACNQPAEMEKRLKPSPSFKLK